MAIPKTGRCRECKEHVAVQIDQGFEPKPGDEEHYPPPYDEYQVGEILIAAHPFGGEPCDGAGRIPDDPL